MTGATIVASPRSEPFRGTVILRDGRVEMVGEGVEVPAGAIRHDLTGRTIYAGWVEPYFLLGQPEAADDASDGASHANRRIRPERRALDALPAPEGDIHELRAAGYTVAQAVPSAGIFRGVTAVVALGDGETGEHVLRPDHGPLSWATFSPDDRWLLTGTKRTSIAVWDSRTGEPLREQDAHGAVFTPDSEWLVIVATDGATDIVPWEMFAPRTLNLAAARERVTRTLTDAEIEEFYGNRSPEDQRRLLRDLSR